MPPAGSRGSSSTSRGAGHVASPPTYIPPTGEPFAGILGRRVLHRTTQYLNNLTEQSHRPVKQRYYPMLGFGSFESASRFCLAFDELRQYFRVRRRGEGYVSLAKQRRLFLTRWRSLIAELAAA